MRLKLLRTTVLIRFPISIQHRMTILHPLEYQSVHHIRLLLM